MKEVNKFFVGTFFLILLLTLFSFSSSFTKAFSKEKASVSPSEIFKPAYQIIDDQYVKISGPTSKTNFLNSSLSSTLYKSSLNSNTARIKTDDNISVYYSPNNQFLGTFTLSVKGDLNNDGEIDMNDVTKIYQYYKQRIVLGRAAQIAGDINDDGSISISDIAKIYQYSKGKVRNL